MRARGTHLNLLVVGVLVVVVAAVVVSRGGSATSDTGSAGTAGTPQRAAENFAGAYLRYLDGQLPVTALPDASARVRGESIGDVIPARDRTGTLMLTGVGVYHESGSSADASFGGRDRRHGYPAQIALSHVGNGWEVVDLVPPDIDTILAPPARPAVIPAQMRAAATAFARGYVDYREGARGSVPSSLPPARRQIATGKDPLARIRPTRAPATLGSLKFGPIGNGVVDLTATLRDSSVPVTVSFILKRVGGRWRPWWLLEGNAG